MVKSLNGDSADGPATVVVALVVVVLVAVAEVLDPRVVGVAGADNTKTPPFALSTSPWSLLAWETAPDALGTCVNRSS